MKLLEVMRLISSTVPITIGTDKGEGWLYYSDGITPTDIDTDFLERDVMVIYTSDGRRSYGNGVKALAPGIAIIVEGNEDGDI